MVGVRAVQFRLLSQNDVTKHTTPLAFFEDDEVTSHRMPRFSISGLFSAYGLYPRKGYYTLEVDHGQLSFTAPTPRHSAKEEEQGEDSASQKRWKPKISQRHARAKSARLRKFPSA